MCLWANNDRPEGNGFLASVMVLIHTRLCIYTQTRGCTAILWFTNISACYSPLYPSLLPSVSPSSFWWVSSGAEVLVEETGDPCGAARLRAKRCFLLLGRDGSSGTGCCSHMYSSVAQRGKRGSSCSSSIRSKEVVTCRKEEGKKKAECALIGIKCCISLQKFKCTEVGVLWPPALVYLSILYICLYSS